MHAIELDAGHIGHGQQLVFEAFGLLLKFAIGVHGATQAIKHAEHIAKIIVDHRRTCTSWKLTLRITHLAPKFVPQLLHGIGANFLLDVDGYLGEACTVLSLEVIELAQRLDGLLEHVRHLLLHFERRCARISSGHHGLFDGERGIFELTHADVGHDAAQQN